MSLISTGEDREKERKVEGQVHRHQVLFQMKDA